MLYFSEVPILKPNLPESKVKKVLAGGIPPEAERELKLFGIEIISPEPCCDVLEPLKMHADMLCHIALDGKVFMSEGQESLERALSGLGFNISFAKAKLGREYPLDVPLNAAFIGSALICRPSAVLPELLNYYRELGVKIIETQQGYSKCSVSIVAENAIITEDESIYKACLKNNVDVLLIKKGYVNLPGFDCGFIGGASGLISKDCLAFCGGIENHPSYKEIKAFAANYGVSLISLSREALCDIGGIIALSEIKGKDNENAGKEK